MNNSNWKIKKQKTKKQDPRLSTKFPSSSSLCFIPDSCISTFLASRPHYCVLVRLRRVVSHQTIFPVFKLTMYHTSNKNNDRSSEL